MLREASGGCIAIGFEQSALADLLGGDFGLVEIQRLYECHDKLFKHKKPFLNTVDFVVANRLFNAYMVNNKPFLLGKVTLQMSYRL